MRIAISLIFLVISSSTSVFAGDRGQDYGTIVHADGSMTAIYASRDPKRSYVVEFDKNGKMQGGGCSRESVAAYQARKAYMTAKAKWRPGYVPMSGVCHQMF